MSNLTDNELKAIDWEAKSSLNKKIGGKSFCEMPPFIEGYTEGAIKERIKAKKLLEGLEAIRRNCHEVLIFEIANATIGQYTEYNKP